MRLPIALAALALLATFAPPSLERVPAPPAVTTVLYTPVTPDGQGGPQERVGRLRFLGGWVLTSNDERFGGLSAIAAGKGVLTAASDAGWAFRFPLPGAGRPHVAAAVFTIGRDGEKLEGDAESLAAGAGTLWLGYEQSNSVRRVDAASFRQLAETAPPAMSAWDENSGAEAMVRLPDGRFIVFAEGSGGDSEALLFFGDPARGGTQALRLRYRPPAGFRITDAALLPDGRLIFLNRRFRLFEGFSAKLTIGRLPAAVREGELLTGEPLADFTGGEQHENFEGVSATREGGRTILWIVSDDNYLSLQRTLLMKLALEEGG